ncbi:MAG TPA: glycosyltransferase family 4 protein [Acidimicrobiales bacterium]|nr:glycosyltransferase family 4 protein [Acidimicrobiales bacterium]
MRVMFAITKGEVGGAQTHLRILAQGLMDDGHQVAVVVEAASALAADIDRLGGEVVAWPSIRRAPSPRADLAARRELKAAVERWRPDVLHLHSSKAGVLGTGLLAPPRGVTIFTCHHAPFGPGRQWSHRVIARPVDQLVLARLDGIVSVGVRDVPRLRRIAPRVPIEVIRNAVPAPSDPPARRPLRPAALWVARLAQPKDPVTAVLGWQEVARVLPGATLSVCGAGPLRTRLDRVVRDGPAGSVDVVGFADDLGPRYAAASLFLLVSRVEGGLTMATLEAMANGLVPVASDVGDAPLLEELGLGVCVPDRSPRAVAAAVLDLLGDEVRFDRLRDNAVRYATEERTPALMVGETVAFYAAVREGAGLRAA